MQKVLEVKNLSYQLFQNINISFEKNTFYSIIGCNNSGKTTLFRILSSFYLTNNCLWCHDIWLNKNNRIKYLKNIGVVKRLDIKSFHFKKVMDELKYPLINLNYNKKVISLRIKKMMYLFQLDDCINKNINELNTFEKQKLLFVISLLHYPKVLIVDNALELLNKKEKDIIFNILTELKKRGLTIIYFTSNFENALKSDEILLLSNYQLAKLEKETIFENDKICTENNMELPFIYDLSLKLRLYQITNKSYLNIEEMVNNIWP